MPAITYPLTLPAVSGPVRITWSPTSAVQVQSSEFTYQQKVNAWDGQVRILKFEAQDMTLADAKAWQAFCYKLNGVEGTFLYTDFLGKETRGNAGDNYVGAQVKGANQNGPYLNTDGWAHGVANLLREGDWLSIADRYYSVFDTCSSDGSGNATIGIWPFARNGNLADNAVIKVGSGARGLFRLRAWPDFAHNLERMMEGFVFTAVEAI